MGRVRLSRVLGHVPCALLVCALLGGCGANTGANGVASQTPARVLARALHAATSAATVHVSGSIAGPGRPISIDVELVSGKGGAGTVVVGGLAVEMVQVDRLMYVRGNPALMRTLVGASAAAQLGRMWVKAPAAHGPLAPLATLTDMRSLLAGTLTDHQALSGYGIQTINGRRTRALADEVERATLYISATGTPYPLALVKPGGRISFDRWNQAVTLTPPAHSINVNAL